MYRNTVLALVAAVAVSGCASIEETERRAKQRDTYSLCMALHTALLSSSAERDVWRDEIRSRGQDCGQYAGAIAARHSQINSLAAGLSAGKPAAPIAPITPSPGPLKAQWVSGMNRICVYGRVGGDATLTIQSVAICPLSY